jgi:hypothetical protein
METYESPRVIVLGGVPTHTLATAAAVGASCITKLTAGGDDLLSQGQAGGPVLSGHINQDGLCQAD